uniref:Ig-like domain-containing protein n=1 Tax=Knipowitschia caucasica TaxID=637954 RepID=A0AAV2LAE1_KNICA
MKSWVCLFALVSTLFASGSAQTVINAKTGDAVVLKPPGPPTFPITMILWKHNKNLAVEWEEASSDIDKYEPFKDNTSLNISTGELTLTVSDQFAGEYAVEINSFLLPGSITLTILPRVPKPHISVSCNEEKTKCTLICEGDVTAMTPEPAYKWKFNNEEQEHPLKSLDITPDNTAPEFICELENPVSQESSEPFANPFTSPSPVGGGPKIMNALLVALCLLAVVIIAVVVHRFKSGMWFFQKDSMPWEADFWQKTQPQAGPEAPPANARPGERNAMMESTS